MIRITFIDGKLKLSNDVLMKIPYFAELLTADPSLKKTHVDYEKAKFLVMLEKLTPPMETFLKLPTTSTTTPGKLIPVGFECRTEIINEHKEKDYYITNTNSVLEDLKLKSDKNNYTFDIVKSGSNLSIYHKDDPVLTLEYYSGCTILISRDSTHLLVINKTYDAFHKRYNMRCKKYYFKEIE